MTIYILQNHKTNALYIGQSYKYPDRKTKHFKRLRSGTHSNPILQASFRKHGEEYFTCEPVEECGTQEEADSLEDFYITYLRFCGAKLYNLKTGGHGGCKFNEETKKRIGESGKGRQPWNKGLKGYKLILSNRESKNRKLSELNAGKTHSIETIEKLRKIALSRPPMSDATKLKISQISKRPCSENTKRLISQSLKGRKRPEYIMQKLREGLLKWQAKSRLEKLQQIQHKIFHLDCVADDKCKASIETQHNFSTTE